jgi:hypothetical protein
VRVLSLQVGVTTHFVCILYISYSLPMLSFLKIGIFIAPVPGESMAQLVEALRYQPESRGFDSRWCDLRVLIDIILPAATVVLGWTQPLTEIITRDYSDGGGGGCKGGRCIILADNIAISELIAINPRRFNPLGP